MWSTLLFFLPWCFSSIVVGTISYWSVWNMNHHQDFLRDVTSICSWWVVKTPRGEAMTHIYRWKGEQKHMWNQRKAGKLEQFLGPNFRGAKQVHFWIVPSFFNSCFAMFVDRYEYTNPKATMEIHHLKVYLLSRQWKTSILTWWNRICDSLIDDTFTQRLQWQPPSKPHKIQARDSAAFTFRWCHNLFLF